MKNTVVVGAQWGDEGKAKITDLLAEKADMVIRYQGGCNAGHTVVYNSETYKLHLVPSGILYGNKICFIGAGTVVLPENFEQETQELISRGVDLSCLKLSPLATITMPYHTDVDGCADQSYDVETVSGVADWKVKENAGNLMDDDEYRVY